MPRLDLNFAGSGRVDPRVTFTRASVATYTDKFGVLRTAPAHAPRIDYDPVSGKCLGLLVEEGRTNLVPYSSGSNAVTGWQRGASTTLIGPTAAPDGSAEAMIYSSSATSNSWVRPPTVSMTADTTYTFSVWAKRISGSGTVGNLISCAYHNGTALVRANLSVASANPSTEWRRYSITFTNVTAHASGTLYVFADTGDIGQFAVWGAQLEVGSFATSYIPTLATFTGRTSVGTYHDQNGVLQTAASGVARTGYVLVDGRWISQGLVLEAAATNHVRNSTATGATAGVIGSGGVAPTNWGIAGTSGGLTRQIMGTGTEDGIAYVDVRIFGTDGTYGDLSFDAGTIAAASGQTWTNSVFLRLMAGSIPAAATASLILYGTPNFTDNAFTSYKAITSAPLRTQRYSVTRTFTDAATTAASPRLTLTPGAGAVDFTIRIGLPQLEQGSSATSPIATLGSATVTRSADASTSAAVLRNSDVATLNSLTPWYNHKEGTLIVEADLTKPATGVVSVVALNNGTSSSRMYVRAGTVISGTDFHATNGGPTIVDTGSFSYTDGAAARFGFAYRDNDFAYSQNGQTALTDTSGAVPPVTQLQIGASTTTERMTGHVRRVTYDPVRLPDATLQALTR